MCTTLYTFVKSVQFKIYIASTSVQWKIYITSTINNVYQ